MSAKRHTIVLIHDLWVTPLSWRAFHQFYGNLGYQVLAPAWPGIEGSIADMRLYPATLNGIGAREIVARYAKIIRGLAEPPIIMGHGYGGLIAQLLADQGWGAAAVAIAPIPPKGILIRSLCTNLALLPALADPFNFDGTFLPTFSQFWRIFGNTLPESEARRVYEAQVIPAPCRAIFQVALAHLTPSAATKVDFRNPNRPPLLFIGGAEDVLAPASLSRRIFRKHRASPCLSAHREFPGRGHYLIAEPGWQQVADYALTWVLTHADSRNRQPTPIPP